MKNPKYLYKKDLEHIRYEQADIDGTFWKTTQRVPSKIHTRQWDGNTLLHVAEHGNMDMLLYAVQNNCPWRGCTS
jgi:hypothetical protein